MSDRDFGQMWIVVTRYTTDKGKLIEHGYGPRTTRSNASILRKRILADVGDDPRLEATLVKVIDV